MKFGTAAPVVLAVLVLCSCPMLSAAARTATVLPKREQAMPTGKDVSAPVAVAVPTDAAAVKPVGGVDCQDWDGCMVGLYSEPMSPGETGLCVQLLQTALGVPTVTGTYDDKTQVYVRRFQKYHGLTVQALVDTEMWVELGEGQGCDEQVKAAHQQLAKAAAAAAKSVGGVDCQDWDGCMLGLYTEPMSPGETGLCVQLLQTALGVPTVTGKYDDKTQVYVRRFQKYHGLTVQALVDTEMWVELGEGQGCDTQVKAARQQLAKAAAAAQPEGAAPPAVTSTDCDEVEECYTEFKTTPLQRGATGTCALWLQRLLHMRRPRDVFNEDAWFRLNHFRRSFGLPDTNEVDADTWALVVDHQAKISCRLYAAGQKIASSAATS